MKILDVPPASDPSAPVEQEVSSTTPGPEFVVGIGASAGGLEALERFFKVMPVNSGMAFVVVQHLSPDFKSLMDELLARFTRMAIHRVTGPVEMRPDTIYLLPPRKEMLVEGGRLMVRDKSADQQLNLPINVFFRSLAREQADRAVAIVLSGTGSDGSQGILDIHDLGGLVLVQDLDSARFDGMPRSAAATGVADGVMAPEAMPEALLAYASNPSQKLLAARPEGARGGLPAVFERLRHQYDLDFTLYKPATISRRIDRRAALGNSASIEAYCERVLAEPAELDQLYRDLLIGVTRFHRDPEAFEILRAVVVPEILDRVPAAEDVRVWVAGCATGEEAYSVALLFIDAFEARGREPRLKIFASDVHRESLQTAGDGLYAEEALDEVPEALRRHFLADTPGHLRVNGQLRKCIIFSQHNLLKSPPFTRIDLVVCRNVLIYFQPVGQARAVNAFHFALKPRGVLFLGPSETIGDLEADFEPVDRHWKIYRKTTDRHLPLQLRTSTEPADNRVRRGGPTGDPRLSRAYDALLERFVPTGVLVNERREVLHLFGRADRYLRPQPGRPSNDVLGMTRGDLRIALSSAIQACLKNGEAVAFRSVRVDELSGGGVLDVTVEPLPDRPSRTVMLLIRLEEPADPPASLPPVGAEDFQAVGEIEERLREVEGELKHAKESLQTAIEERETSNEELQASNEELLASNEELQSTNEELHSVNEELYSVNAEHEAKIRELHAVAGDLRNLMLATEIGVIFTDPGLRIRFFTPAAGAIFNLLPQDVGRDLRHITSRIVGDDVFERIQAVESAAADGPVEEARVRTPDGRIFLRRIKAYRDIDDRPAGMAATFVDVTALSLAEEGLRQGDLFKRSLLDALPAHIAVLDRRGVIVAVNERWNDFMRDNGGDERGCGVGADYIAAATLSPEGAACSGGIRDVLEGRRDRFDLEYPCDSPTRPRCYVMSVRPLGGAQASAVVAHFDVTASKLAELERQKIEAKMIEAARLESLGVLAGGIAHDFNNLLTGIIGNASLLSDDLGRLEAPAGAAECLRTIQDAAGRASDLCRQLLAYSGRGRFVVESRNPAGLVRDMANLVRTSINRRVDLRLELDPATPPVVMDSTQIRQVVMNLVINGSEAIGETGGVVKVSCGVRDVTRDTLRRTLLGQEFPDGRYVFIEVTDTGCGIAPEDMARIFEPFYSTKFAGRGLGLSAVLGIVRGHHGALLVTSEPGRGSTFVLLLPPASSGSETAARVPDGTTGWRGTGRVLVVDDEAIVRESAARLAVSFGFEAVLAANGPEALAILRSAPGRFAFVMLDLTMPQQDGRETLAQMRDIRADLPVLLMSGYDRSEAMGRLAPDPLTGFLPKPFEAAQFAAAVRVLPGLGAADPAAASSASA